MLGMWGNPGDATQSESKWKGVCFAHLDDIARGVTPQHLILNAYRTRALSVDHIAHANHPPSV